MHALLEYPIGWVIMAFAVATIAWSWWDVRRHG